MLYLEVGNTTFKLAELSSEGGFSVARYSDLDTLRDAVPSGTELLVAPVAEKRAKQVVNVLGGHTDLSILRRDMFFDFIGESYDTPETLGLDRILNLYALDRDGIVVSCGTAITIDALSGGRPYWGAIMPGFRTASEGLTTRAPALPIISINDMEPLPVRTSRGAVANGVIWGTVIGVQGLVLTLAERVGLPEDIPVILTGGELEIMAKFWLSASSVVVEPALLFEGMARKVAKERKRKEE